MTNREKVRYVRSKLTEDRLLTILIGIIGDIKSNAEKEQHIIKTGNFWDLLSDDAMDCAYILKNRMDDLYLVWGILNQLENAEDFIPWGTSLSKRQNEMLDEFVNQLLQEE